MNVRYITYETDENGDVILDDNGEKVIKSETISPVIYEFKEKYTDNNPVDSTDLSEIPTLESESTIYLNVYPGCFENPYDDDHIANAISEEGRTYVRDDVNGTISINAT